MLLMVMSTLIRPLPRVASQQALQKQPSDKPRNHLSPDDHDDHGDHDYDDDDSGDHDEDDDDDDDNDENILSNSDIC